MFDNSAEWEPENLDKIPPGYVLAAVLDDIDTDRLSGHDQVRVLQAHERMRAHYAAESFRTMAKIADSLDADDIGHDFVEQAAAAEVAAALRLTRRTADNQMALALELRCRLPRVWLALCEGTIDVSRARVLVDYTLHLSITVARDLVNHVIGDASLLTTGQLRAKLRKLCIEADPEDAKIRYTRSVTDRRVIAEPTVDGTADLHALNLPPHRVTAAMRRINRYARRLKHAGDDRTMDQIRADVLLDLIDGTQTGIDSGRGSVHLTVDLATLAELADHPGDLAGYGPVIADIARRVTHNQSNTVWRWTLKDPSTGQPIDGGIARRRPTAAQQRKVHSLNPVCIHPGCRMPAVDCDIDHTTPWAESHTTDSNDLAPLCRHHHRIRHQAGWRYEAIEDGDYRFTSNLGHAYTTSGRSP